MEIVYSSRKLEKILMDNNNIKKEYGINAKKVMNRMSEIRAANSLLDIPTSPPPRRHKLEPLNLDQWGIDYSPNFRIVIEAVGEYDRNDLSTIKTIRILRLEDYH